MERLVRIRLITTPIEESTQSIEQELSPLGIEAADRPHDVTAGMQTEGARLAHEPHINLAQQVIALAVIAGMAARDQVFPCRHSPPGAWNHVVQRELGGGQHYSAILAGVAVAQQNILPRERARLVRNTAV